MASTAPARDGFEAYFSEKLWELVPAIYRHEDGIASPPGVLRAVVELLGEEAARLRRSHDRLWDDQFVELCDEWAVPYIGDLVGTRLVSALNLRGRRVDVAKTIYYRRRAGTLTVLEELASDIAGWEGTAVEMFRRLARVRHGLDPPPATAAGPLSGTPAGGSAALRRAGATELVDGAFDEFHHLPDVRRPRGTVGRHAIPKLAFHLFRIPASQLVGVTPRAFPGGSRFTFDPSGREVPLFAPRSRPPDWTDWRRAREWELPQPIRCRLLSHAEYELSASTLQSLGLPAASAAALGRVVGRRFPTEAHFRRALDGLLAAPLSATELASVLEAALVADCGKHALLPTAIDVREAGATVPTHATVAGALAGWVTAAAGARLVVDPERGRFVLLGSAPARPVTVGYWYGFAGSIGAGPYDRRAVEDVPPDRVVTGGGSALGSATAIEADGVTQIDDSATYTPVASKSGIRRSTLQAANRERPFLDLGTTWRLATGTETDSTLVLDGLWIGGGRQVRLAGDYELVTISHSTLDPGGADADGNTLAPVELVVEGQVEELRLERSVLGPIVLDGAGAVEKLVVRESILSSLALERTDADVRGVTVLGPATFLRLFASEALFTGLVDVTDTQAGCFRFSAAPAGSRLPRPYRSHVVDDARPLFTSRRFGDPGYGQLSEAAPTELVRGAENGSEIGAFSGLIAPIRADSLRAKVDEFAPFGLIPVFVRET